MVRRGQSSAHRARSHPATQGADLGDLYYFSNNYSSITDAAATRTAVHLLALRLCSSKFKVFSYSYSNVVATTMQQTF